MNKYLIIILLPHLDWFPQSSSLSQKNLKGNLFYKVHTDIQNTVNTIFGLLQLNKNFTTENRTRLLLSMHATMKGISERNYPPFKDIKRACKLYIKGKPKAGLFNLDKLINILVQEKLTPGNTPTFSDQMNKTGINLQLTSFEIPDNEEDSFAFLKAYLNNLDVSYSFDSPLQKIKDEFEKNKDRVKEKRRLKAWKGLNMTKEKANSTKFRRVFHGKNVKIKRFPFLASIHELGMFICAGSIISKLMIITAASCLQTAYYNKEVMQNTDGITVRLGSDHTDSKGHLCNVSHIFFHPNYNPDTLENNLAIVKIKKALQFTDRASRVRRIEYSRMEGNLLSSTEDILIVGWGDTNADFSNGKEPLTYSHLDVFKTQTCVQIYTSKYVNDMNFCAGSKGAGACQRDIGGPGIAGNVLVGVISFGPPVCGAQYAPTVFTNIGSHIAWIDSVIQEFPINISTTAVPSSTDSPSQIYVSSESKAKLETTQTWAIENEPVMRSRSSKKYPKAIQILTYLLNGLLTAGLNADKMVSNDNNDDSDRDNLRKGLDNITLSTIALQTEKLEKDPKEVYSPLIKGDNIEGNVGSTKGIIELRTLSVKDVGELARSFNEAVNNDSVSKVLEQKSNSYIEPKLGSSDGLDRIYLVMKGLQSVLGLNGGIKFSEVYKSIPEASGTEEHFDASKYLNQNNQYDDLPIIANRVHVKESNINNSMVYKTKYTGIHEGPYSHMNKTIPIDKKSQSVSKVLKNATSVIFTNKNHNEVKDSSSNMSDNYETENDGGMSIEFSSELPSNITTLNETTSVAKLGPYVDSNEKPFFHDETRKHTNGPQFIKDDVFEHVNKQTSAEKVESLNQNGERYDNTKTKILDFINPPGNLWPNKRSKVDSADKNIIQQKQASLNLGLENDESGLSIAADNDNPTESPNAVDDVIPKISFAIDNDKLNDKYIDLTTLPIDITEYVADDRMEKDPVSENSKRLLDYIDLYM